MRALVINIIFLFISTGSMAQPWSACFTADKTKIITGVTVNMNDCSGSTTIFYDYGEGGGYVTATSHTYNTPGTYTVKQFIFAGGASGTDSLIRTNYITVYPPTITATYNVKICTGRNITLTITDNIDTAYVVNFGDGPANFLVKPNTPTVHTYTDNLSKTITVVPFLGGTAKGFTFLPLDVLVKPDISSITVDNQHATSGQITIRFNAIPNQRYIVQQSINSNAAYINIDTLSNLSGAQTYTLSNLNTASNRYCYRLVSYDDCATPVINSEEICSIINTVTAANNQNDLLWSAHLAGNVNSFLINRTPAVAIPPQPAASTTYTDNAVNCGVNYCYTITAQLTQTDGSGANLQSISDDQCVTATSTNIPTAIQNLNSTISGNSASLSWDVPVGFSVAQYQILRSVNGGAFSNYATTTVNSYSDNGISIPGNTYCYMVNYTDVCNNASLAGTQTCPVILDVTVDNTNNSINNLSWSAYTGSWAGVQDYTIEKLDENNNITATINVGLALSYNDIITNLNFQALRYRIKATATGGGSVSYSNIVEIKYEGNIFLPNAFTPDGDGTNDTFFAKGKFIKTYKLTIYNRWGEVVYAADQMDLGWNGFYQGSPANPDAYAYLVEAVDLWGKEIIKRGSVTLLR
ncbi:MAG: gliding motility-associated C-terminal domain-containing protein [Cytophagaceae bacterium]|nr:gliding motility-associated C-terminal domain-containing protein [Cytophagaceae bacterium]